MVTGGTIIGERNGHLGTTGEDGFGIWIKGSTSIRIDGVSVRDCWGDGILIGGSRLNGECRDVTVSNCVSRNNRRQGLSVLGLFGGLIENSEFTDTNGTAPESGIDVEPSGILLVSDLTIRNCTASRNAGYGMLLAGPMVPGINPAVSKITLDSVNCTDNALDGATLLRGATLSSIKGSRFERNRNNGIQLVGSSRNDLLSNTFRDNGVGDPSLYASVRLVDGSSDNTISNSTYSPVGALTEVAIVTPDCVNNVVA
jgi:parallel beta-helix repeat protein